MERETVKSPHADQVEHLGHYEADVGREKELTDEEFADDAEVAPEAIGGNSADELPAGYYKSFHFIGTILAIVFGTNALYLAGSLPLNVLANINEDIGPDPNYVWVAVIFSVMSASTCLLGGRLSDLLGRRWLYIGSTTIGLVGCIIAAAAPSIPVLIVGAALIGIHAGPQQSLVMLVAELIPNKYRAYVLTLVVNSALPLLAFGPIFIRLMIKNIGPSGWRWAYGTAAIGNGVSVVLLFLAYHPPSFKMLHARSEKKVSPWRMVDFVGVLLFVASMTIFLLGLSWGGSIYPWKSGKVIGFIVGGAVILIIFGLWEVYVAKDYPLIPTHLFRNKGFMGIVIASGIATMTYFAFLILWPIQLSLLYNQSLMGIGWKSCVIQCGTSLGYFLSAALMRPLGKQKWQFIYGMTVLAAFMGGMAGTTPSSQTMALFFLCIVGASIGWIECLALTLAPFCLKHDEIGLALGLVGTSRATLAAIGQTIFTTIYTNKITTELPKYVVPAAMQAGLPESSIPALLTGLATGNLTSVSGLTPSITVAAVEAEKLAYSKSFQTVYLVSLAFAILGIITSLFSPNAEKKFNSAISRRLQARKSNTDSINI